MSSSFIGSQIAIITKSQCRYVGKIIGIDSDTSSILLGNVKCFGTENRPGNFSTSQIVGTIVPMMQFANSDIEDLKIVPDDSSSEPVQQQQQQVRPTPVAPPPLPPAPVQSSIHDDPAIVTAVMSSSDNNNNNSRQPVNRSNQLMHGFQHLNLSDEQPTGRAKREDYRISSEPNAPWSFNSDRNVSKPSAQPSQGSRSRFFDHFNLDQSNANQSDGYQSHTHSSQNFHDRHRQNNGQIDERNLPALEPFFSDDRPCPPPQQQTRHPNGHTQNQTRHFQNHRPSYMHNQQRGNPRAGGNRETFHGDSNNYNADFDFEGSNQKFNKIASEDEFKQHTDGPDSPFQPTPIDNRATPEYAPLYDKKKSFFDNSVLTTQSEGPRRLPYNRSNNQDTFGYDSYQQRQPNRAIGPTYRRANNNNYRQQQGNDESYYRQQNNGNGHHYRY